MPDHDHRHDHDHDGHHHVELSLKDLLFIIAAVLTIVGATYLYRRVFLPQPHAVHSPAADHRSSP